MNFFETESMFNESVFYALKKYYLSYLQKIIFLVVIVLSGILLYIAVSDKIFSLLLFSSVFLVITVLRGVLTPGKYAKVYFARLKEAVHAEECACKTSFGNLGFTIVNLVSNATFTIYYEDIKRFIEIKDYFVLQTKAGQFGLINAATIEEAGLKEELIEFLKSRCEDIRF